MNSFLARLGRKKPQLLNEVSWSDEGTQSQSCQEQRDDQVKLRYEPWDAFGGIPCIVRAERGHGEAAGHDNQVRECVEHAM